MISIPNIQTKVTSSLRQVLAGRGIQDPLAIDLIEKLLSLNPAHRIRADAAAKHDWFVAEPKMFELSQMPRYEESHEMGMKSKRLKGPPGTWPAHPRQQGPTFNQTYGYQNNTHNARSFPHQGHRGGYRGGNERNKPKWQEERR